MSGNITIKGLDQLQAKLNDIKSFRVWAQKPLKAAQEIVKAEAQEQPAKSGTFTTKATPAQKRAYWAKVRSGEARHGAGGYIRSNKLKASWKTPAPRLIPNGLQGSVTNEISYGQFVQGQRQQSFHADSGFKREQQIADDTMPAVQKEFDAAIKEVIK